MFNFIEKVFAIKKVFLTLMTGVIVLGLYSYWQLPSYDSREYKTTIFILEITHPGMSANDVESQVIQDLENRLDDIEGVKIYQFTVTDNNYSSGIVIFDFNAEYITIRQDLANAVEFINGIEGMEVKIVDIKGGTSAEASKMRILFGKGKLSDDEFLNALNDMKRKISKIKSVSDVTIQGMPKHEFTILLDPVAMEQYSVDVNSILNVLKEQDLIFPVVELYQRDLGSIQLPVTEKSMSNVDDMMNLRIPVNSSPMASSTTRPEVLANGVRLKDVANVRAMFEPKTVGFLNEDRSFMLKVYSAKNADLISLSNNVRQFIDEYTKKVPIEYRILKDRGYGVSTQVSNFMNTILTAIILNAVLIVLFVGLQFGFGVVLTIPLTFLMLFIYMYFADIAISFMSLFACVLSIGLIVDTSIIISDMTQVYLRQGFSLPQSYIKALKVMLTPVLSANMTTISVFLPMWLLADALTSKALMDLIIPVALLIIFSMLIAIFVMPVVTILLFSEIKAKSGVINNLMDKMADYYSRLLRMMLHSRTSIAITSFSFLAIVAGSLAFIILSNTRFSVEPASIVTSMEVEFESIGDMSDNESKKLMQRMIGELQKLTDVNYVITKYSNLNKITYELKLVDMEDRKIENSIEYTNMIYSILPQDLKDVTWSVNAKSDIGAPGRDFASFQLQVTSDNLDVLNNTTRILRERLKKIPDVINPNFITQYTEHGGSNQTINKRSIKLFLNRQKLKDFLRGIPIGSVIRYLQLFSRDGYKVDDLTFAGHSEKIPVYIKFDDKYQDMSGLMGMTIQNGMGQKLPMSEFVDLEFDRSMSTIFRFNGTYSDVMFVPLKTGQANQIFDAVDELRDAGAISTNVNIQRYDPVGEKEAFLKYWTNCIILSVMMILLILFLQFGSFWQIIINSTSLALSVLGSILIIAIVGNGFSFMMSGMGIACLMGVVVNHNIVLLDAYNRTKQETKNLLDAVVLACKSRLRPILLTTFTTAIAISPIIFGVQVLWTEFKLTFNSITSEIWFDFSLAFGAGLLLGTMFTLIATPLLIVLGEIMMKFFGKMFSRLIGFITSPFKRGVNNKGITESS